MSLARALPEDGSTDFEANLKNKLRDIFKGGSPATPPDRDDLAGLAPPFVANACEIWKLKAAANAILDVSLPGALAEPP